MKFLEPLKGGFTFADCFPAISEAPPHLAKSYETVFIYIYIILVVVIL
jgi:hypothetical protein